MFRFVRITTHPPAPLLRPTLLVALLVAGCGSADDDEQRPTESPYYDHGARVSVRDPLLVDSKRNVWQHSTVFVSLLDACDDTFSECGSEYLNPTCPLDILIGDPAGVVLDERDSMRLAPNERGIRFQRAGLQRVTLSGRFSDGSFRSASIVFRVTDVHVEIPGLDDCTGPGPDLWVSREGQQTYRILVENPREDGPAANTILDVFRPIGEVSLSLAAPHSFVIQANPKNAYENGRLESWAPDISDDRPVRFYDRDEIVSLQLKFFSDEERRPEDELSIDENLALFTDVPLSLGAALSVNAGPLPCTDSHPTLYTSLTPDVCGVRGERVEPVDAGICTIRAAAAGVADTASFEYQAVSSWTDPL